MGAPVAIRPESPDDRASIRAVVAAAFGQDAEADLVDALRRDPTAWLSWGSIVAVAGDLVVGHVLGTRLRVGGAAAIALAPLAVSPPWQRRGIGSRLVHALIDTAIGYRERLIVVLGDPAYYSRFGFGPAADCGVTGLWDGPEFQALALARPGGIGLAPRGAAVYPPAFRVL